MATHKTLGPAKFNNITVKGDFEFREKPWTICFYIKFTATPTKYSEQYFNGDLNKFHNDLVHKIGLKVLQENLSKAVIPGWQFHLANYGYDHSPKEFRFEKPLDFQVNAYYIAPSEFEDQNDWKGLERPFQDIARRIAKLPNFTSDHFIEFSP